MKGPEKLTVGGARGHNVRSDIFDFSVDGWLTRRAATLLRRIIQDFFPFDLLVELFVRIEVTYRLESTRVNGTGLRKTDDTKEHSVPIVVKETIFTTGMGMMPLVRFWSGKFNNRVPEPLTANASHLMCCSASPNLSGDQIDLLRHIPARSRSSAHIHTV